MKKHYILSIAFITVLITSCTQRVYLTVNEPPAVHLDKMYDRGGVVNRSFAEGGSEILETIENGLTLEGDLDLRGSNAAVQGVFDQLTTNQRFQFVTIMDSLTVKNGGIDVFPAPLPWFKVEKLCLKNEVGFLIALEVYDTDTKVSYSTGTTTKNTPLGSVTLPTHNATVTTIIKTGWRIYDPVNKLILDEFWMTDRVTSRGSGINPVKALSTILNRGQAVTQLSNEIGRFYARRIEPQSFRVWRDYFNKGSQNLKIAKRRSEVGDWDGAAEMWEKDLDSPKRKVAGRAHYNMAIYKEIQGDVEGALEMAQKAYSDYNIKQAQNYARILRNRLARRERDKALSGD
ncbi:MAG: hypothetical protein GQ574_21550 [Crocinitomix sp.]|nr:hypothetical protein [Crocinitomix sp.]